MTRIRRATVPAVLVTVLAVVGCTGDPAPDDGSPTTAVPAPSSAPPAPATPVGDLTAAELSEEIFAAAEAEEQPLASATTSVEGGAETTLDVLEVRSTEDGTWVRFRLAAAAPYAVGLTVFADERFGSQSFVRDVHLDDPASGTRLLPLQFEDYRDACVCPYKPLELGPEPIELTAVFPPLPTGTQQVDVGLGGRSPLTAQGATVG